jgi:hypothetical protein
MSEAGLTEEKHGESLYNLDGRIGGDSLLSSRGEQYARKLPDLVLKSVGVSFDPHFLVPRDALLMSITEQSTTDGMDFDSQTHHRHCPVPPTALQPTPVEGSGRA